MYCVYHVRMSTEVVQIIDELKSFSSKYIVYNNPQDSIVREGRKIIRKVGKMQRKHCCASYVTSHEWCELEYWLEIVRLICARISSINRKRRNKSVCETYSAFRYDYIGLPTMMYPNRRLSFIKTLTLLFLALSGVIQLLRVQLIDSQLSFWSQVTYFIGSLITIVYFIAVQNCDLAYPYIGGCIISALTVWGIFLHNSTPWESL